MQIVDVTFEHQPWGIMFTKSVRALVSLVNCVMEVCLGLGGVAACHSLIQATVELLRRLAVDIKDPSTLCSESYASLAY